MHINASGFRADIRYNNVFDRPEKTIDTIIVLYVYTYYFFIPRRYCRANYFYLFHHD